MHPRATVLTLEGKAKLDQELEHLVSVRRREVAERIHQAMEFSGDPVDNAEYQDAKDEQAFVEGRIRELENILATATVAKEQATQPDTLQIGCTVTVIDIDDEDVTETFTLVGSMEADPLNGRYSLDSPVGRALLGHRAGETVVVSAPAGDIRYRVASLTRRT
jgi:transcription elongation factor GreA